MPNILLESMGAAKPIACSDKMPMNEFLKEGGIYFNASSVNSIFEVLEKMLNSLKSFGVLNHRNKEELKKYTWNKTSSETFKFIINTLKSYNNV
jgi:glycosyltransferase involved in cell wall biosynthesis